MPVNEDTAVRPQATQRPNNPPENGQAASLSLPTDAQGRFAGQLQLIGLSRLRMHLGGNWEKNQPKIHVTVENIISTNLRPKDISTRIGQDHYILYLTKAQHLNKQKPSA